MLVAARLLPSPTADNEHLIANETQELASLSSAIRVARAGLVQELVEVFNIVQVGGRPSIGGKAGTKGEWTIGDLILPVPGDIRRAYGSPLPFIIHYFIIHPTRPPHTTYPRYNCPLTNTPAPQATPQTTSTPS